MNWFDRWQRFVLNCKYNCLMFFDKKNRELHYFFIILGIFLAIFYFIINLMILQPLRNESTFLKIVADERCPTAIEVGWTRERFAKKIYCAYPDNKIEILESAYPKYVSKKFIVIYTYCWLQKGNFYQVTSTRYKCDPLVYPLPKQYIKPVGTITDFRINKT